VAAIVRRRISAPRGTSSKLLMRSPLLLSLFMLALSGCDRLTSPSIHDAGPDSLAALWEHVDAGTVNFNAVAGSNPGNVMVVGDQGTILRWDGTALQREESGTLVNLRGVAVVDETLAFAVGEQGTVLRRQEGAWVTEEPVTTVVLNAVAATADYAMAVGEQGTILLYKAGLWSPLTNAGNDNYYAVADTNAGPVVVGSMGIIIQPNIQNGTIPRPANVEGFKLLAGATRTSSGAYLVGVDGGFFSWASGKATRLPVSPVLPRKFLRGVSVVEGTTWIVGHEGLVAKLELGSKLSLVPTLDDRWLLGVYAAAPADLWIVGRSGLILRGPPGVRGVLLDGGARD
jgi:photosystem II stability/assembly factor-like uncharacterized protein